MTGAYVVVARFRCLTTVLSMGPLSPTQVGSGYKGEAFTRSHDGQVIGLETEQLI